MADKMVKVDGLSSAFFRDGKYSIGENLARRSLIELQNLETRQRESSGQLVSEAERSRKVAEGMIAPLLRDLNSGLAEGNAAIQARLRELHTAFSEGNQRVGDQIAGIPGQSRDLEELLASGAVDESEVIILAAAGVLDKAQAERFFAYLPDWKIGIIKSGLVTGVDVKAEQALTSAEKVFLAQLRRKTASNPLNFGSLTVFALNGLLDAGVHHALAERIPDLRYGVEGVKYEVRDLNRQAATLVSQGDRLTHQGTVGINQREIALRLMRAGVLQAEELTEVARDSLGVQRDSLGVQRDTLAVQTDSLRVGEATLDGIGHLKDLSAGVLQNTGHIADRVGHLSHLSAGILQNTADIAGNTAYLVDIASALRAIGIRNSDILAGMSERMDVANEIATIQLRELVGVNESLDILRRIGIAHLETSGNVLGALDKLGETLAQGFASVTQVVEAVRQTLLDMERRSIDRDQNSEKNLARQSFEKAMKMLEIGQIDKAIKFFDESEARWPADFSVYFQRGLCYVFKDNPRAAESDFSDAVKLASGENEARTRSLIRLNLARLYHSESKVHFKNGNQNEYEEKSLKAIEEAKRAVKEDPEFLEAQFGLATYLASYQLFDEALKILVKIIPENPGFIKKIEQFDVFAPLQEALKNTLGEDMLKSKEVNASQANLAIARDCVMLGDFETAKKCLNFLFDKDPEYLRQSKIWAMPEFAILNNDISQMTRVSLNSVHQHESEWAYAVIGIALNLEKIDKGLVYNAFKEAVEKDADFHNYDSGKIREKCVHFAGDKADALFKMIRTKYPSDLPTWLTYKLKI